MDQVLLKDRPEQRISPTRVIRRESLYHNICNAYTRRDKCEFFKGKIIFFGHVFSDQGISTIEEKISAIVNATPTQSKEEVRSLLGMAQYVSWFIPNYSATVEPLRVLTK